MYKWFPTRTIYIFFPSPNYIYISFFQKGFNMHGVGRGSVLSSGSPQLLALPLGVDVPPPFSWWIQEPAFPWRPWVAPGSQESCPTQTCCASVRRLRRWPGLGLLTFLVTSWPLWRPRGGAEHGCCSPVAAAAGGPALTMCLTGWPRLCWDTTKLCNLNLF